MRNYLIFWSLILTFLFWGCLNLEMETFVAADGSGSAIIHYWTDLEILYSDTSTSNIFSFNENIIKENFSSDEVEVKSVKVWENKADTTFHAEVKIVFDDINNLNSTAFYKDYEFSFKDGAVGQKIFEQKIQGSKLLFGNKNNYHFKFIYHFPGSIITDNADHRKNNTLIWNFTLDQFQTDKTLTATIKVPDSSISQFLIPSLIIILILLWILLFLRRKRKKSED